MSSRNLAAVSTPLARPSTVRRLASSLTAVLSMALVVDSAAAQSWYALTVHNNFGQGEFYGATPQDSDIWLVTNMAYDYVPSGSSVFVTGNASAGTWTTISLATIDSGSMRLQRSSGGTRMYAVLSSSQPAAAQPDPNTPSPNNYFEWSFDGAGNPGVLDFSWIDRYDFPTRMVASGLPNNVNTGVSDGTQTFGAKPNEGTTQIGQRLALYASQPQYAWLGTGTGGFSQPISYASTTGGTSQGAVGWVTRNQSTQTGYASDITSFTLALDRVIATASGTTAWNNLATSGTGPNWLTSGFRVGYPSQMNDPQSGTASGGAWTAYANFEKTGDQYTLKLSDFTLYTNGTASWSAVTDAAGAVYEVAQAGGMLEAIWTSSWNILSPTPAWVANLGPNGPNVPYELYNAIASGVIYRSEFVNDTPLPNWTGYAPRIVGVDSYNYEIFTAGAPVDGAVYPAGLQGYLSGADMVTMLAEWDVDGTLVNPYFLELVRIQQQTPAYLYPSQDSWLSVGTTSTLGMQPQPLNGQAAWGDLATLDWYLGNAVAIPEPSVLALLAAAGLTLAATAPKKGHKKAIGCSRR
jgi:hypothetical protein